MSKTNGITYFRLISEYPGDYTKNCGLLGNEVDQNFYFLRGNDIKTAYTEDIEDKKYLVLEKLDGEKIKVDITSIQGKYQFKVEGGYIYVKTPEGEEIPFGDEFGGGEPVKFLVEGDSLRIITDSTIIGDGTYENPIGIDPAYRTGQYVPADFFIDLTCTGCSLDDVDVERGHAVVTRESASYFGALYTYEQAKALNKALSDGWRLPSREDWAKLLNWAEEDEEDRNHDNPDAGKYGCVAGYRLKSLGLWNEPENRDDVGFSIYPVGACPHQLPGPDDEYGYGGLYTMSSFWSSTERSNEAYSRTFSVDEGTVTQGIDPKYKRFSIRLVRDITGLADLEDFANILGVDIPVVLTTDGTQQWTSINISLTNYAGYDQNCVTVPVEWNYVTTEVELTKYYELVESGDGYCYAEIEDYLLPSYAEPVKVDEVPSDPEEDSDQFIFIEYTEEILTVSEAKLFYNVWDGKRWHKKMMSVGETVVFLSGDTRNGLDKEWQVFFNEELGYDDLRDKDEELYGLISALTSDVQHLSAGTLQLSADTYFTFQELSAGTIQLSADTYNTIQELSAGTIQLSADTYSTFVSAFTEINANRNEINNIEEAVGLNSDGTYIVPTGSTYTSSSTTIAEAIAMLDESMLENEYVTSVALNDLNDRLEVQEARTITAADKSVVVVTEDVNTTIKVNLDPEESHIKLGNDGLYFDCDFADSEGQDD